MSEPQRDLGATQVVQPITRLVPAVVQAIKILDYLGHVQSEAGVSEIARALRINKSTCFNILSTLRHEQLVSKSGTHSTYRIGPRLLELATATRRNFSKRDILRSKLHALVEQTGNTCVIGHVLDNHAGIVMVDRIVAHHPNSVTVPLGYMVPLSRPMGLLVLARLDNYDALDLAKSLSMTTDADSEQRFLRKLQSVRELGYTVTYDLDGVGLNLVAAGITDQDGQIESTVCLLGDASTLPDSVIPELGTQLVAILRSTERKVDLA